MSPEVAIGLLRICVSHPLACLVFLFWTCSRGHQKSVDSDLLRSLEAESDPSLPHCLHVGVGFARQGDPQKLDCPFELDLVLWSHWGGGGGVVEIKPPSQNDGRQSSPSKFEISHTRLATRHSPFVSTSNFQSEVSEVFGEIGGELPAKFGRRFSSFFCGGNLSEAFSTKTPPLISPSNFTMRFWVVSGPTFVSESKTEDGRRRQYHQVSLTDGKDQKEHFWGHCSSDEDTRNPQHKYFGDWWNIFGFSTCAILFQRTRMTRSSCKRQ